MSKINKYEIISLICAFTGIFIVIGGLWIFAIYYREHDFMIPIGIAISGTLFMIPMIIFANKAFNLEVDMVKNMSEAERENWINDKKNKPRPDYVARVLHEVGGYQKKWVRVK